MAQDDLRATKRREIMSRPGFEAEQFNEDIIRFERHCRRRRAKSADDLCAAEDASVTVIRVGRHLFRISREVNALRYHTHLPLETMSLRKSLHAWGECVRVWCSADI